jgi:uncharacterized phage protein gp47/JayE
MAFIPKTARDVLRQLRGAVIGRTSLSDISEGSALSLLLGAFAEELASTERRLLTVRESFFLNGAVGVDLDARISELPPVGISRIGTTHSSGSVLTIRRAAADTAAALTVPSGSVFQANDGTRYITTIDVVMGIGDAEVENVHIIAEVGGITGNQSTNNITLVVSAPDEVISCTNTQPLTNGQNTESDVDLRDRATAYLKSLSRCQRSTIEYMARSFVSSEGERFPYAKMYEDPEKLGYCELVIDDGSGLKVESVSRVGRTSINTVSSGGARTVYHEAPATGEIQPSQILVYLQGNPNNQVGVNATDYTSLHERGVIYFKAGVLAAGDQVVISDYRVFRGYVAELQKEIEGDPDSGARLTGFRAAGTRIVVNVVTPQFVTLDIALSATYDADYDLVERDVLSTIETTINSLAPSETLIISRLVDQVMGVTSVRDVQFFQRDSTLRAENIDTIDARHALRVTTNSLQITTTSRD